MLFAVELPLRIPHPHSGDTVSAQPSGQGVEVAADHPDEKQRDRRRDNEPLGSEGFNSTISHLFSRISVITIFL